MLHKFRTLRTAIKHLLESEKCCSLGSSYSVKHRNNIGDVDPPFGAESRNDLYSGEP